jgi:hypothetical protein
VDLLTKRTALRFSGEDPGVINIKTFSRRSKMKRRLLFALMAILAVSLLFVGCPNPDPTPAPKPPVSEPGDQVIEEDETGGEETGGEETGGEETGGEEAGDEEAGDEETGDEETDGEETDGEETDGDESGDEDEIE